MKHVEICNIFPPEDAAVSQIFHYFMKYTL